MNKLLYYLDKLERIENGETVVPVTLDIHPSNRCNQDCSFCYYKDIRHDEELPIDIYYGLISASRFFPKAITFTGGGEPMMHPEFNKMVLDAHELGYDLGLVTNGTMLDQLEHPEWFKWIRVSLDAGTKQTYLKIKGKDYFDKVIRNMETYGTETVLGLSFIVCKKNKHEIDKMFEHEIWWYIDYIQFKPAWINDEFFTDYLVPGKAVPIINTKRYIPHDTLPCTIAGLVGTIGADAGVYYCCQWVGHPEWKLGTLKTGADFMEIFSRRADFKPDISKCGNCRYGGYAEYYRKLKAEPTTIFSTHRNFI